MMSYLVQAQQKAGATVSPANIVSPSIYVHLGVTITVSVLVALLFLAVYIQLMMVLCFGYKLISYQTVLLFDILLWAALRLTLYSFYFRCCELIQRLDIGWGWLLVAFPSVLQYISLAVLVHYFGEVSESPCLNCLSLSLSLFLSLSVAVCYLSYIISAVTS